MDLSNSYYAPQDWYSFSTFAFVIDKATNKSIPIIAFIVFNTGPGDFSTVSKMVPGRIEVPGNVSTTAVVGSKTLFAKIKRPVTALALTFSMFAINWVLTIFSIIATLVASQWESDAGIALLPITVILAIPTIRNIYSDSPFGVFLGTCREGTLLLSRRLTVPCRRGRILPANADSGVVHSASVVVLYDADHTESKGWGDVWQPLRRCTGECMNELFDFTDNEFHVYRRLLARVYRSAHTFHSRVTMWINKLPSVPAIRSIFMHKVGMKKKPHTKGKVNVRGCQPSPPPCT